MSPAPSLRIYSIDYARGGVVKLTRGDAYRPVAKFVIEKQRGHFELYDATGARLQRIGDFPDYTTASGLAIRECERIRSDYSGGVDAGTR